MAENRAQIGRFQIESMIGKGAMGVIYRTTHPGLGLPIAIKVLNPDISSDPNFRQVFQREAALIASLNHPGVVRVYDFDEDQGQLFIVMELVEGRSLREVLDQVGRLELAGAVEVMQQLLSAVGAAHSRGIVHRDLKPENVLVSPQGKTKILDFGVAQVTNAEGGGFVVGTPIYISPEQVRAQPADARSDIYTLGVMLYEFLHGKPPFEGSMLDLFHAHTTQPLPISPHIPPAVMEVILQATAKAPEERFASCDEFGGRLLAAQASIVRATPATSDLPPVQTGLLNKLGGVLKRAPGKDEVHCSSEGCTNKKGWTCSYVDSRGEHCATFWCKEHAEFIDKKPYCRRHANVLRQMAKLVQETGEQLPLPDSDDRAFPLLALVMDDVHQDVSEIIRRRYQFRQDLELETDGLIDACTSSQGEPGWERIWAAVKPGHGPVMTIAMRVYSTRPDTVNVMVGEKTVLSEVPEWVIKHHEGRQTDFADRGRFRSRVVGAIQEAVENPSHSSIPVLNHSGGNTRPPALPSSVLMKGIVLRLLGKGKRTGGEIADFLGLPYASVEPTIAWLRQEKLVVENPGPPVHDQPAGYSTFLALTPAGSKRESEVTRASTAYLGPAPVKLEEYMEVLSSPVEASLPIAARLARAMSELEVAAPVLEKVAASCETGKALMLTGQPGNGKSTIARQLNRILPGPLLVPVALDLGGHVMTVFDSRVHVLAGKQPEDKRWRLVEPPLIELNGGFDPASHLLPRFDSTTRVYAPPPQMLANGGVLMVDAYGQQPAGAAAVFDRLVAPLRQGLDTISLIGSGAHLNVPFKTLIVFVTDFVPENLLDAARLAVIDGRVEVPGPSWQSFAALFEAECRRAGIPYAPQAVAYLNQLYGTNSPKYTHPRLIIDALVGQAREKGLNPALSQTTLHAAFTAGLSGRV